MAAPKATLAYIAAAGLPAPFVAYLIAIAVEIGGSALLVLGYHTRLVGLGMAVFAIATALAFHHNFGDQAVELNFLKNLAIAGGLLNVAAYGGGTCSLDARRKGEMVIPRQRVIECFKHFRVAKSLRSARSPQVDLWASHVRQARSKAIWNTPIGSLENALQFSPAGDAEQGRPPGKGDPIGSRRDCPSSGWNRFRGGTRRRRSLTASEFHLHIAQRAAKRRRAAYCNNLINFRPAGEPSSSTLSVLSPAALASLKSRSTYFINSDLESV